EAASDKTFALVRLLGTRTSAFCSISGNVFQDTDGDGFKDTNERPFVDARVYVDFTHDNAYEPFEPSCLTDSAGNYKLDGLPAGTFSIRIVVPTPFAQTLPLNGASYPATVGAGQNVGGRNFGLQPPKINSGGTRI